MLYLYIMLRFLTLLLAPLIGITSGLKDGYDTVPSNYYEAVIAAGGIPVAIPHNALWLLDQVDGLVVTGGEDVDPARYGQEPLNNTVSVNSPRDTSDFAIVGRAMELGMPILGVCRGMQLLNVACGGSLVQDIPTQVPGTLGHSGHSKDRPHLVKINSGTKIFDIVGRDTLSVNSLHHQAVQNPGKGLRVVGRTADGVAEMLESTRGSKLDIIGVQSHPEIFGRKGEEPYLNFYRDLVRRAERYKEKK